MSEPFDQQRVMPVEGKFTWSASTVKIDSAFAKAQGEFQVAAHDKKNPHYKSTFASLASVWNAVRAALGKHEVHVTQWPMESEGKRVRIVTRVSHAGEFYQTITSIPVAQDTPQGHGSSYTYLRRYALLAILGLADDETDDDAEHAEGRGESDPIAGAKEPGKIKKEAKDQAPPAPKVSPMQQVGAAISRHGRDKEVVGRWIRHRYPNVQFQTMSQALADEVIKKIENTPDEGFEMELKDQRSKR